MKIAIITSPFGVLPPLGFGAVEKVWYHLAFEFSKENNQIQLISKRYDSQVSIQFDKKIDFVLIKGYKRTGSIFKDIFLDFLYSINSLIKLDRTDILIINTFWSPVLSFFFKYKIKKSVYNVQRIPKNHFFLYRNIDRFSCVSFAVYNILIEQNPSLKEKARIIGNPIDISVWKPSVLDKSSEYFTLIYSGRIHPEKGIELLVKACNVLINSGLKIKLNLIGPRSVELGGGGDRYIILLNELAESNFIEWIDPLSNPVLLRNEINKGKFFCYPSIAEKGETFGVAPLEAMALGLATIVSDLDCFKDFVKDDVNGLIFDHRKENSAEILADKIKILINSPDKREKLGKEAMKTVLNYSNEKIAIQYLNDFKQLLKV
jgi:glycosyltransferase involved in cell wall biosynthesis